MTNRIVKHEIKLQPSLIAILAVLALGVGAYAFAPAFEIRDAKAQGGLHFYSGSLEIKNGLDSVARALRNISACSN